MHKLHRNPYMHPHCQECIDIRARKAFLDGMEPGYTVKINAGAFKGRAVEVVEVREEVILVKMGEAILAYSPSEIKSIYS